MSRPLAKISQIIKQAYVSLTTDDSEAYPLAQVTSNEMASDAVRLSPYGLDSNPPAESFCLLLSSQAQEAVKFAIISDMMNRKKSLAQGEVALYNTLTHAIVKLSASGNILICNDSESLAGLLADLITEIKNIQTFSGYEYQVLTDESKAALQTISDRLANLLDRA